MRSSCHGEVVKFRPFASTFLSGFMKERWNRFFSHLSWTSVDVASLCLAPRCVSLVSVSLALFKDWNVCVCLFLLVLCWASWALVKKLDTWKRGKELLVSLQFGGSCPSVHQLCTELNLSSHSVVGFVVSVRSVQLCVLWAWFQGASPNRSMFLPKCRPTCLWRSSGSS